MVCVASEGGATCFCQVQDALSLRRAAVVQNLIGRSVFLKGKLKFLNRNTTGRGSLMLQRHPKPHIRYYLLYLAFPAL